MKTVLITGASSGLGKALTRYFSENGWCVLATMLSLELGEEMRAWENVHCYQLDVCCTESISKAKKEILATHMHIDAIINNAGIGYRSFVELSDDTKIEQLINVNWMGVVRVCRAFIPVFKQQQFGQFINISSIAGLVNLPLGNFYHPTKHAVESFSECMAYELKNANIQVCTLQFGNIPTDFQKNLPPTKPTTIAYYNNFSAKIAAFVAKRSEKNTQLINSICKTTLRIAEHPARNFRRYTIGFDARFLRILHKVLGYQIFRAIVRRKVLN